MKKISGISIILVVIVMLGLWLASGFYTIQSGEEAVLLRFGKHIDTITEAGLSWHMPAPIDRVEILNVVEPRRIEIGFQTLQARADGSSVYKDITSESIMITSDENLVDVETVVQYRIKDINDYLFNVNDQNKALVAASESAIRRVVANHILDEILTDNKFGIQSEIKTDLQEICDSYDLGISITAVQLQDVSAPQEVDDAFKDVTNAREDKTSFINESESYANEVLPRARGNAAQILNEAGAYKEKRVAEARGDVANFEQILERYNMGERVTRTRLYLETLEKILPGIDKYIVDGDSGTIKFLPLEPSNNQ